MKVVVLGKGLMLANLIEGAITAGVEISGVFRYENLLYSRFKQAWDNLFYPAPELELIKKYRLKLLNFKSANSEEFRNYLIRENIDLVVIGTWREKIEKSTFQIPKIGTINVHPSLLPAYRGPNPYLQTILNREKFSGVTFHLVTEKLDAGEILAQAKIPIQENYTGKELREKTVLVTRFLFRDLLEKLKKGCVDLTIQNENLASYYPNVKPEEMTLNFYEEPAEKILARVKAFHPFLPTYIQDGERFWVVNPYNTFISDSTGKPFEFIEKDYRTKTFTIACSDGKAITFKKLVKYSHLGFLRRKHISPK